MVTPESFSHVGLRSDDVEGTVEFFEARLDADVLDRGEITRDDWERDVSFAALSVADKDLFVVDPTPYEAAGLVAEVRPGVAHYGFVVDDVDAALAEWMGADGDVLMEPFTLDGVRYAFCHGPDDTRIELVERGAE